MSITFAKDGWSIGPCTCFLLLARSFARPRCLPNDGRDNWSDPFFIHDRPCRVASGHLDVIDTSRHWWQNSLFNETSCWRHSHDDIIVNIITVTSMTPPHYVIVSESHSGGGGGKNGGVEDKPRGAMGPELFAKTGSEFATRNCWHASRCAISLPFPFHPSISHERWPVSIEINSRSLDITLHTHFICLSKPTFAFMYFLYIFISLSGYYTMDACLS